MLSMNLLLWLVAFGPGASEAAIVEYGSSILDEQLVVSRLLNSFGEEEQLRALQQAMATGAVSPRIHQAIQHLSTESPFVEVRRSARRALAGWTSAESTSDGATPFQQSVVRRFKFKQPVEEITDEANTSVVNAQGVFGKLDSVLPAIADPASVSSHESRSQPIRIVAVAVTPNEVPNVVEVEPKREEEILPPISVDASLRGEPEAVKSNLLAEIQRRRAAREVIPKPREATFVPVVDVIAKSESPEEANGRSLPTFGPVPSSPRRSESFTKVDALPASVIPKATPSVIVAEKTQISIPSAVAQTIPRAKLMNRETTTTEGLTPPNPPLAPIVPLPPSEVSRVTANKVPVPLVALSASPSPKEASDSAGLPLSESFNDPQKAKVGSTDWGVSAMSFESIPRDKKGREELAWSLLAEGREKARAGDAAGAEAILVKVRELAVQYKRWQYSPESLERDLRDAIVKPLPPVSADQ